MTIITALASDGKVWIGFNDKQSIGDTPMPGFSNPWIIAAKWALGVSGSTAVFDILEKHKSNFLSEGCVEDVVAKLRGTFSDNGIGKREDDEASDSYGISCILAHVEGRLWDVDRRLGCSEIPEGVLWARGSGMDYALGAEFVLSKQNLAPAERVKLATDAAISLDLFCPGASQVRMLG